MSRINQPPRGLQDLLGSQNFGDNPSDLAETVIPSLEMLDFLSAEKIDFERIAGSRTARGGNVGVVVPEGELWFMMEASGVGIPDLVGDSLALEIDILEFPNAPFPNAPMTLQFGRPPETILVTGDTVGVTYSPPRGFLPIWSGTSIRLRISHYQPVVVANVDLEFHVMFVRLKI